MSEPGAGGGRGGDGAGAHAVPIDDFYQLWLQQTTGNPKAAIELAYSINDVCERYQHDPDCGMFLRIMRGSISEQRDDKGNEVYSNMELLRLALPRRVFTLSQIKYTLDRIVWLYQNRDLVGGLKFVEEPKMLRFFFGKLATTSDWQGRLMAKFVADLGSNL